MTQISVKGSNCFSASCVCSNTDIEQSVENLIHERTVSSSKSLEGNDKGRLPLRLSFSKTKLSLIKQSNHYRIISPQNENAVISPPPHADGKSGEVS